MPLQAEEGSPIKPGQALRDERGRVNLDDLTDTDLDYGCDEKSLASLRRRLKKAINTYDGTDPRRLRKSERATCPHRCRAGCVCELACLP